MHAAHTLEISHGSTKGDYRGVQKWYFEDERPHKYDEVPWRWWKFERTKQEL